MVMLRMKIMSPSDKSTPEKDKLKQGLEVVEWLGDSGLSDHPAIRSRINLGLKTGNFESLHAYLKLRNDLRQKAKTENFLRKQFQEQYPFYFPSEPDFLYGNIPLGECINPEGKTVLFKIIDAELPLHNLVLGKTGEGKSNAVLVLLLSLTQINNVRSWIFTVDKEYRKLKKYCPDYKVVNVLREFWDNPFEPPYPRIRGKDWLQIICDVICAENNLRQSSKNILFNIGMWLFETKGIFKGSEDYPTCQDFLNVLLKYKQKAKTFQEKASYEPLINRFRSFCNLGALFTTKQSPDYIELQKQNIIFEFIGMGNEVYSTVMAIMAAKAFYSRLYESHTKTEENILHIVVEEARKAFDARRDYNSDQPESILNTILSRARKYCISMTVVSQEPHSISRVVNSNVNLIIALRLLEGDELTAVQRTMRFDKEQMKFYSTMPKGMAVVKYGGLSPFVVQIPLFPEPDSMPDDEEVDTEASDFLKDITPENTGEHIDIDTSQNKNSTEPGTADEVNTPKAIEPDSFEAIPENARNVLMVIADEPFSVKKDIRSKLKINSDRVHQALSWLTKNDFAVLHKTRVSKGRASHFHELTDKAYSLVQSKNIKVNKPRGKGSFKSKLYSWVVCKHLENFGWTASIEGLLPGTNKLVDVLAHKDSQGYVAYEITLSDGNVIENIEKDFQNPDVSKIVLVFENQEACQKAQEKIFKADSHINNQMVDFLTIENFY